MCLHRWTGLIFIEPFSDQVQTNGKTSLQELWIQMNPPPPTHFTATFQDFRLLTDHLIFPHITREQGCRPRLEQKTSGDIPLIERVTALPTFAIWQLAFLRAHARCFSHSCLVRMTPDTQATAPYLFVFKSVARDKGTLTNEPTQA